MSCNCMSLPHHHPSFVTFGVHRRARCPRRNPSISKDSSTCSDSRQFSVGSSRRVSVPELFPNTLGRAKTSRYRIHPKHNLQNALSLHTSRTERRRSKGRIRYSRVRSTSLNVAYIHYDTKRRNGTFARLMTICRF